VRESTEAERLYRETVVPKARANVEAAQADYVTGNIPFLTLIEAERNVIGLQDRYYEIVTDYFRRRAALERAVGGPLAAAPTACGRATPTSPPATGAEELPAPRPAGRGEPGK
jgi:outer membrane protein TolC